MAAIKSGKRLKGKKREIDERLAKHTQRVKPERFTVLPIKQSVCVCSGNSQRHPTILTCITDPPAHNRFRLFQDNDPGRLSFFYFMAPRVWSVIKRHPVSIQCPVLPPPTPSFPAFPSVWNQVSHCWRCWLITILQFWELFSNFLGSVLIKTLSLALKRPI